MLLTRLEIADHVSDAFHAPAVSKTELVDAAEANRARNEVVRALQSLPDERYRSLRDLWPHLPEVPVAL